MPQRFGLCNRPNTLRIWASFELKLHIKSIGEQWRLKLSYSTAGTVGTFHSISSPFTVCTRYTLYSNTRYTVLCILLSSFFPIFQIVGSGLLSNIKYQILKEESNLRDNTRFILQWDFSFGNFSGIILRFGLGEVLYCVCILVYNQSLLHISTVWSTGVISWHQNGFSWSIIKGKCGCS